MPNVTPDAILKRLKAITHATTDTDLAQKLGHSKQSIAYARKSGKIPDSWLAKAADQYGVSMDWLRIGVRAWIGFAAGSIISTTFGTSPRSLIPFGVIGGVGGPLRRFKGSAGGRKNSRGGHSKVYSRTCLPVWTIDWPHPWTGGKTGSGRKGNAGSQRR